MIKKTHFFVLCLLNLLLFAIPAYSSDGLGILSLFIATKHSNCPQALAVTHPNFCASFRSVAQCHCTSSGLPAGFCADLNTIYNRMISIFGSQQKACEYQKDTSTQICMDDWNCFRLGGKDSHGNLCSSTGHRC